MAMECISHAYMQSIKTRTVIEIMHVWYIFSIDLYHPYDTAKSVILSLIIIKDQFYRGTVTTYRTTVGCNNNNNKFRLLFEKGKKKMVKFLWWCVDDSRILSLFAKRIYSKNKSKQWNYN